MSSAAVRLWGRRIAAVTWVEEEGLGYFEYVPDFVRSGIQVAPLTMPLARQVYRFAQLRRDSFHGLPGLLADSLPDDFGNALIDAWLASQGRAAGSLNPVERLCYTGRRGMGALEFEPVLGENPPRAERVELEELVQLASRVLQDREAFCASLDDASGTHTMQQILQVGTSAGGARAKAVLAWNPQTGELRSGQAELGAGFEDWVLKFDGVSGNGEHGIADPQGYGRIEFAYHRVPCSRSSVGMSSWRRVERKERGRSQIRRSVEGARRSDRRCIRGDISGELLRRGTREAGFHVRAAGTGHGGPALGGCGELGEGVGQGRGVAFGDEQAGLVGADEEGDVIVLCGDDREAAGLGLEEDRGGAAFAISIRG
jgi:serine/threonine-protein kinase HipA